MRLSQPSATAPLRGDEWVVREVDGVDWDRFNSAIQMVDETTIRGDSGCNLFDARYRLRGGTIAIRLGNMTRGRCWHGEERDLITAMKSVNRWRLEGSHTLILSGGGHRIRLMHGPTADGSPPAEND